MQTLQKACAGCGGAALGAGLLAHTPCLLIALGMASGVSATTAVGASFYSSLAVMIASGLVLARSMTKNSRINMVKIGATSALVGASLTLMWSQISNPVNTEILQSQSALMEAPRLSLWEKEKFVRINMCGTPRNAR